MAAAGDLVQGGLQRKVTLAGPHPSTTLFPFSMCVEIVAGFSSAPFQSTSIAPSFTHSQLQMATAINYRQATRLIRSPLVCLLFFFSLLVIHKHDSPERL